MGKNVEADAQAFVFHGVEKIAFLVDLAARGIEEDRSWFHQREKALVKKPACLWGQRQVYADDIGALAEIFEGGAEGGLIGFGLFGGVGARRDEEAHPEGFGAKADFLPDPAPADDPEGLAFESVGFGKAFLVPKAVLEALGGGGDLAIEGEKKAQGKLCDSDRIFAGAVGDVDPPVTGRSNVDIVGSGPHTNDQHQVFGLLDRGLGDLGASDTKEVYPAQGFGQGLGGHLRLVAHFDAQGSKVREFGFRKLVSDQETQHRLALQKKTGVGVGRKLRDL